MTRRLRQPNRSLAALITEAGFSKKGLAARVIRAGESRGFEGLRFNHSSVERWLRGERPRPPTPSLLAEVFSAKLARPVTVADLGMSHDRVSDEAALSMPLTTVDVARVVHGLAEGDLEQRRALIGSGFDLAAYSSAALRWLLSPRTAVNGGNGSRRIGAGDIQAIREAIQAFRVLDNRLGGGVYGRRWCLISIRILRRCCVRRAALMMCGASSFPPLPNCRSFAAGRRMTWRCRAWRSVTSSRRCLWRALRRMTGSAARFWPR